MLCASNFKYGLRSQLSYSDTLILYQRALKYRCLLRVFDPPYLFREFYQTHFFDTLYIAGSAHVGAAKNANAARNRAPSKASKEEHVAFNVSFLNVFV